MMGGIAIASMPTAPTSEPGTSIVQVKGTLDETLKEAVLMQEEEKMMVMEDEEITSVESNGTMEDPMMNMAMLNSIADQHGGDFGSSDNPDTRLRKRRRIGEKETPNETVPNPLSGPLKSPKPLPMVKVEAPTEVPSSDGICLDVAEDEKRKVCFEDPVGRSRGFSIDLDRTLLLIWACPSLTQVSSVQLQHVR